MSHAITAARLQIAIEDAAKRRGLNLSRAEIAPVRDEDQWIATLTTEDGPRPIRLHGNWLMRVGSEVAADICVQRASRPGRKA